MFKTLLTAAAGMLAGVALVWLWPGDAPDGAPVIERDLLAVSTISLESAEQHRAEGYAQIVGIEQVLALPTRFARGEALYTLAGRADSGEVQSLIQDAARIADPVMRRDTLGVLFMRLTELDPLSALAVARAPAFAGERSLESNVWRTWGQLDLDTALAAATQESGSKKNIAAQALFSAHGYVGTLEVERIAAATGVRPDNSNRWQYLSTLIDISPRAAADYVNSLSRLDERRSTTWQLANHVARVDPDAAAIYAALLDDPNAEDWFAQAVASNSMQRDPAEVVEKLLAAEGRSQQEQQLLYGAMHQLADQDLEKAMQLYASATKQRDKQILGQTIAGVLAQQDPVRALAWARQNDNSSNQQLFQMVLQQVAQHDSALALAEAQSLENPLKRSSAVSHVIQTMAWQNPQEAIQYISLIENPQRRNGVLVNTLARWMESDTDAAINWLESNDADIDPNAVKQSLVTRLASRNISAAIRVVDQLDDEAAAMLRPQIVRQMVMQESVAAAENYLRQFEGTPEYTKLKASMISGVAQHDPLEAKRLANELPTGAARDGLMQQLVMQVSESDPQTAAAWIGEISTEQHREQAISSLAMTWGHFDQQAAVRWADTLPRGADRNMAIVGLSNSWQELTPSRLQLVESIGNAEARWQAQTSIISVLAQQDRAAAQSAVRRFNLTSSQQEQAEQIINNSENGGYWGLYPPQPGTRITTSTN